MQREQFFVAGSSVIPSCLRAFVHSFTHSFTDLFIGEANINEKLPGGQALCHSREPEENEQATLALMGRTV